MIYFLTEQNYKEYKHAGFKAKIDANRVFEEMKFTPLYFKKDYVDNFILKCIKRFSNIKSIKNAVNKLNKGDYLFIQYPIFGKSDVMLISDFSKIKDKGIKIIFLIHDLDFLRDSKTDKNDTLGILKTSTKIIVHNSSMKNILQNEGFKECDMINLEIFDYLIDDEFFAPDELNNFFSVIIAGNLDFHKSSYIYQLPENIHFNMYGINFDNTKCNSKNVSYKGSFAPDILHKKLEGSFGLVWDGNSIEECAGEFGHYLIYNNPHKMSLYLAAGLPIIIRDKAAQSEFVKKHNCGIVIDSLNNLDSVLLNLSHPDYTVLKNNAIALAKEIRKGRMLKKAIQKCLD